MNMPCGLKRAFWMGSQPVWWSWSPGDNYLLVLLLAFAFAVALANSGQERVQKKGANDPGYDRKTKNSGVKERPPICRV